MNDPRSDAVARLIASGLFERSPGQERLLVFLSKRSILQQTADLKEFTVAVEAFGRSADFDPKSDSIVRVEMHRLRRRLREHYGGKGTLDAVKIVLPEKSYLVEFHFGEVPETVPPAYSRPAWPRFTPWLAGLALIAGLAAIFLSFRTVAPVAGDSPPSVPPAPPASAKTGNEIRILCGRPSVRYVDPYGHIWEGDRYYRDGESATLEAAGAATGYDQNVVAGMRAGNFSYRIPIPAGPHEVMLIFAEPALSAGNSSASTEETREFAVRIQGRTLLSSFDVKDAAGGYNIPHFRVFKDVHADSEGQLNLEFQSSGKRAFVNAIVVRPGIAGKMRPVRILARREPFRDSKGNVWEPDQYFRGGRQIPRPIPPPVPDSHLYLGERHGTFQYDIPVAANSRYTVNLHFWESWWGVSQDGGPGSRVFSVYCNFRPLLEGFDLLATRADPPVVQKTFRGLEPDSQGKLSLAFVPSRNRAMINAIEVLDEGSTPLSR